MLRPTQAGSHITNMSYLHSPVQDRGPAGSPGAWGDGEEMASTGARHTACPHSAQLTQAALAAEALLLPAQEFGAKIERLKQFKVAAATRSLIWQVYFTQDS